MKITELPAKPKERQITRVAAYARVSSDKDAAFHSLEAQTEYYEQYVAAHPDWQLVGIYSGNGISDPFARNTVILLETIRELKRLGVDTYFEKEDMHSISPDGELLVTLLAMYAEEEARSASENQRWRIVKRFENGEPWVGKMLGYRLENCRLVVVPEEAEIVRQIYEDYLSGMGHSAIAKKLKLQGVSPASGNTWSRTSIRAILMNEKYTGSMILQKTYRKDFRTKKTLNNHGEKRKYFVEHSHEAIIDQETFDLVQAEMVRRAVKYDHAHKSTQSEPHLFCGILQAGSWACPSYYSMGKDICPAQKIPEDILIEKTMEVLGISALNREILLEQIRQIIVPAHSRLRFILRDGTVVDTQWRHRSRRESWTDEMKESARQRTLAQNKKEEK